MRRQNSIEDWAWKHMSYNNKKEERLHQEIYSRGHSQE